MSDRWLIALLAVFFVTVTTVTFFASLPGWCATPDVGSNWIVQPLCK